MNVIHRIRGGKKIARLELPDVFPVDDIMVGGRSVFLTLKTDPRRGGRPYDSVPYFSLHGSNSGMAFPEVLRAYAKLFSEAADYVEGKEPIDFQI